MSQESGHGCDFRKQIRTLGGALLGVWLPLGALQAAPTSLDDCVAAALKASPALAALRAQAQAAVAGYSQDRDGRWPGLTLSDQENYSAYQAAAGFSDGTENFANAELALDLQSWIASPAALSRQRVRRIALQAAQLRVQLGREVAGAYDRLMVLELQADEGRQAAAYVDGHLGDIQRLRRLGVDVQLDLLRAGSQRRSLDLAAVARDAEIQDQVAALRSLTGLDLTADDFRPDPAWVASVVQADAEDPGQVLDQRLLDTLPGRLAALDLETARLATRGTGPVALPTVKLGLNHAFQAIDPATPVDQAYAALSLYAFDWGQRAAAAREKAQALAAQAADNREQLRQLRLDAGRLAVDRDAARRAYALSVDLLGDAQKAMGIAKTYYRQGKIKETDLLSIFSDYLTAQQQRDVALQTLLDKRADWDALWEGSWP